MTLAPSFSNNKRRKWCGGEEYLGAFLPVRDLLLWAALFAGAMAAIGLTEDQDAQ
jgi:hypothetical protein